MGNGEVKANPVQTRAVDYKAKIYARFDINKDGRLDDKDSSTLSTDSVEISSIEQNPGDPRVRRVRDFISERISEWIEKVFGKNSSVTAEHFLTDGVLDAKDKISDKDQKRLNRILSKKVNVEELHPRERKTITKEEGIGEELDIEELEKIEAEGWVEVQEQFVELLEGRLGKDKAIELFRKLCSLAAKGELTEDSWNDLMEEYGLSGLKMNSESFAALICQVEDKTLTTEKVAGVYNLCKAISDLHLTLTNFRRGESVVAAFERYAQDDNFYFIEVGNASGYLKGIFEARYKDAMAGKKETNLISFTIAQIKSSRANKESEESRDRLERELEELEEEKIGKRKSEQEKWEVLTAYLLRDMKEHISVKSDERYDPYKAEKIFAEIVKDVLQNEKADSEKKKALANAFVNLVEKGSFDWEKVLGGKKIEVAEKPPEIKENKATPISERKPFLERMTLNLKSDTLPLSFTLRKPTWGVKPSRFDLLKGGKV